jgi:hypothetical protein
LPGNSAVGTASAVPVRLVCGAIALIEIAQTFQPEPRLCTEIDRDDFESI